MVLGAAAPAPAAEATCVKACEAKMNSCAEECSSKSGHEFEVCQLGCSKALFVRCVQDRLGTGAVAGNGYEVRVPGKTAGDGTPPSGDQGTTR